MSYPPTSAIVPVSSPKKKARSPPTNVSRMVLMGLQSLILAFAAYESPALAGGGKSFTEAAMEKFMTTLCFGDGDGSDRETICYVDQFLAGVNRFKGLFTASPASRYVGARVTTDTHHTSTSPSTKWCTHLCWKPIN